jgi:hypothetical protein
MDILGRISKAIGGYPVADPPKVQSSNAASSRPPSSGTAASNGRRRAEARSDSAKGVAAFKDNWRAIQVSISRWS